MSAFDDLKRKAAAKRDAAIQKAREEYRETVKRITALQSELTPPKKRRRSATPLHEEISNAVPRDSCFTVPEIADWLGLTYDDHDLIRNTINRMMKRGDIKRVRRGRSQVPAVFAVSSYGPPASGIDLILTDAAKLVLRETGRPMSALSLTVELLERGYEPTFDEKTMHKSLRDAMRRKPCFIESGGLWEIRAGD